MDKAKTQIGGLLTTERGYQYAWTLRTLAATEQYAESILLEVISCSQKVPARVVTLRGATRDEIKGLLLAFVHELDG